MTSTFGKFILEGMLMFNQKNSIRKKFFSLWTASLNILPVISFSLSLALAYESYNQAIKINLKKIHLKFSISRPIPRTTRNEITSKLILYIFHTQQQKIRMDEIE